MLCLFGVERKVAPQLRKVYADKILDLTNIGAGATLFGQLVSGGTFSWLATSFGLLFLVAGYTASYLLYLSIIKTSCAISCSGHRAHSNSQI